MGEREPQNLPDDDEAEQRIARARATIGKSFEELIARTENQAAELGTAPLPAVGDPAEGAPPPSWEPAAAAREGGHPAELAEGDVERRIVEATAGIEARISEWVNGRVHAAERRLELQSQALEASLGQGAESAQHAIQEIERAKAELAEALGKAQIDVAGVVEEGRRQLEAGAVSAGQESDLKAEVAAARTELEASFAEAIADRQNDSIARVEEILLREAAKGDARSSEATRRVDESLTDAERRAEATIAALETRCTELRKELEEAARSAKENVDLSRESASATARDRLEETIAPALREAEAQLDRVRAEIAAASEQLATSANETEARIEERLRTISTEIGDGLQRQVDAALGDRIAELEPRLEGRLSEHVARELESVKSQADAMLAGASGREQERLDAVVEEGLVRARAALEAQEAVHAEVIERERSAQVGRAATEMAKVLVDSRLELERLASGLREDLAASASQRAAEEARAELDARSIEIETRLTGIVESAGRQAEERLLDAATIVEDRLTAVDRAQEREELVRRRTAAAENEAERRVQEAEQRLLEVLGRLEPAQRPAD